MAKSRKVLKAAKPKMGMAAGAPVVETGKKLATKAKRKRGY